MEERESAAFIRFVSTNEIENEEPASNPTKEWDSLIFSQQWPITSCIAHKESHHGAACRIYKNVTTWTVHGLWPSISGSRNGPQFCNKSWPFIESRVADIEPQLLKYWTNIFKDTGKLSLWQHEWSKHGTCAASEPQLGNEHKYFSKGLQWVRKYDLLDVLSSHGITPSTETTYTSEALFSAITSSFGTDPIINCVYDKETKTQLVSQIKLCFHRNLTLVSCNEVLGYRGPHRGNCPPTGVYYLPTVSNVTSPTTQAPPTHAPQDRDKQPCSTPLCQAIYAAYALSIVPL
ncbi:ribonuclease Oy-like isoform X3 [Hyalella azteca]|uniref:Ribonuclease Oy-like isoform X3 n=1 Tax=Hyalella azteca TaxID=294128 RepID=A0A8B7PCC5_HYAAZ|nr:ribonuclease Oy-like isoform X3 [Hyalella azteca]